MLDKKVFKKKIGEYLEREYPTYERFSKAEVIDIISAFVFEGAKFLKVNRK